MLDKTQNRGAIFGVGFNIKNYFSFKVYYGSRKVESLKWKFLPLWKFFMGIPKTTIFIFEKNILSFTLIVTSSVEELIYLIH